MSDEKLKNYDYKNGYNSAINDMINILDNVLNQRFLPSASIQEIVVQLKANILNKAIRQ